jgi:hypothetical protein
MERTRAISMVAGAALALSVAPAALAANVGGGCGSADSGHVRVTYEQWWERTVEFGFGGDEALAVEVLAPLWGVEPTLEAVKAITLDGIANVWDKNANGFVCWKDLPNTPGNPTYVFIVKDDAATD